MAGHVAAYKCRLCGEVFLCEEEKFEESKDFRITNVLAQAEQCVIMKRHVCSDVHRIHNCKDGSRGFCDLQGFKKVSLGYEADSRI